MQPTGSFMEQWLVSGCICLAAATCHLGHRVTWQMCTESHPTELVSPALLHFGHQTPQQDEGTGTGLVALGVAPRAEMGWF